MSACRRVVVATVQTSATLRLWTDLENIDLFEVLEHPCYLTLFTQRSTYKQETRAIRPDLVRPSHQHSPLSFLTQFTPGFGGSGRLSAKAKGPD